LHKTKVSILKGMNIDRAKFVKSLVDEGHTYRSIHRTYQIRYIKKSDWWISSKPEDMKRKFPHGNVIIGLQLCSLAKIILKTTHE